MFRIRGCFIELHALCGQHQLVTDNIILCLQWSFSADMLVLDPGERYRVSVFNIPKPELGHSYYDVSHEVLVPGESKSEPEFGCCCCVGLNA